MMTTNDEKIYKNVNVKMREFIQISSQPRLEHRNQKFYICGREFKSNSKFAPKREIVYILPSIDTCIGFLPKDVGNHILSYTNVWLEFYLENLILKYGNKFFNNFICDNNVLLSNNPFTKKEMRNGKHMMLKVLSYSFVIKDLRINFNKYLSNSLSIREQQLAIRREKMFQSKQNSKIRDEEYKIKIKNLDIGSIVKFEKENNYYERYGLVINKTSSSIKFIYFSQNNVVIEDDEVDEDGDGYEGCSWVIDLTTCNSIYYENTKTMRCRDDWFIVSNDIKLRSNSYFGFLYLSVMLNLLQIDLKKPNNSIVENKIIQYLNEVKS